MWGIYHALMAIGQTGASTLDKVAGPVGEALVMTAVGLLVALPAVFAYNTFVRLARRDMARLQDRSRTLLALMATDQPLLPTAVTAPLPQTPAGVTPGAQA